MHFLKLYYTMHAWTNTYAMINIPIGSSYDFLTVNDHEFLLNLTGEFLPTFGAVRVSTYTSYTHILKKSSIT